ncbi:hypothetical protein L6R52_26305, partial [Myxococcota bacterium]|nr:hypothetical protein [Myxococcota bacterium]
VLERLREQRRQRLARAGRAAPTTNGDLASQASAEPIGGADPALTAPVPLEQLAAAVAVDPATVAPRQGLDPASPAVSLEGAVAVQAPVAPARAAVERTAEPASAPSADSAPEPVAESGALAHEQPIRAPSALEAELEARSAPAVVEVKADAPAERPKRPSLFDRIGLGRTPSQDNDA